MQRELGLSSKMITSLKKSPTGITVDGVTVILGGLEKNDKIVTAFSCSEDMIYDGIKVKTEK